ncbi:MAG: efflux RND transporter permease subunit, partial [Candidatus Hinthialibacter sp.]
MKISLFSVRRPITTIMFYLMVILFGVISFIRLPIDLMPDITYPSITVATSYTNVGPQEMEQLITRPIEETVSSIQGVEELNSTSSEGESRVRVSFTWGTDLDEAANDVRTRIDRIRSRLPEDADTPRIYKFDLSSFPVVYLGVSGKLDPVELLDVVEHQVKYRLERIPGVAAVEIRGGLKREIHVDLDRHKITALNLSLDAVLDALSRENINLPAGKVDEGFLEAQVRTQGEFQSVQEIENTVIQMRDDVPILLKDIAVVEDSHEEITHIFRSGGVPVARMAVNKQSGSNTVQVAEGVMAEVERINESFPQLHVFPIMDSSTYIKSAIANVRNAAGFGAILAIFILYYFLRNMR